MATSHTQKYDSSLETVLHKRSDLHILRKLWHISTGSLGIFLFTQSSLPQNMWAAMILAIAITGFVIDIVRSRVPLFNRFVIRMMGPLMRRSERDGVTGLPFYALGVSLSLFFYSRDIAIVSCMFLVFSGFFMAKIKSCRTNHFRELLQDFSPVISLHFSMP